MVAGNYHKQKGFGFGGFEWSKSVKNLRTLTLRHLDIPAVASEVVFIDVHVSIYTALTIIYVLTLTNSLYEDGSGPLWCGHLAAGLDGKGPTGRPDRGGLPHRGRCFRNQGRSEEQRCGSGKDIHLNYLLQFIYFHAPMHT